MTLKVEIVHVFGLYGLSLQPDDISIMKCKYGCCTYNQRYPTYMVVNQYHSPTYLDDKIFIKGERNISCKYVLE